MTVSTTSAIAFGVGNGATSTFTFPFTCPATTDIVVWLIDTTASPVTMTNVTSSATISLNAVAAGAQWAVGGSVIYSAGSPIATGKYLAIVRSDAQTQATVFANQNQINFSSFEQAIDLVVMIIQEMQTQLNACVQIPIEDRTGTTTTLGLAANRASANVITDASGNVTTGAATTTNVSSAMVPVVTAATLAAARSAMGVISDPTTNEGDIVYRHTGVLAALAVGAANTLLTSNGTDPAYSTLSTLLDTLIGSTNGTMIARSAGSWGAVTNGSTGQFLSAGNPPSFVETPFFLPGGRLTLQSGVPIMTTSQSAKTAIFYTPYLSGYIGIYNGSFFRQFQFSEFTLNLDSNAGHTGYQQSGKLFDLFITLNSGTPALVTGPAWSSTTSRGSGAGTTQLSLAEGVWTNAVQMTAKFDATASTLTVTAGQATYVGTMLASADGQCQFIFGAAAGGGTAGQFNLWNQYNRVPIVTQVSDTTASWNSSSNAWHSADGSTTMRVTYIAGQLEDPVRASYGTAMKAQTAAAMGNTSAVGVGVDVVNALSGTSGTYAEANATQSTVSATGTYAGYPGLGEHFIQAIEFADATHGTTFFGTSAPITGGLTFELRM